MEVPDFAFNLDSLRTNQGIVGKGEEEIVFEEINGTEREGGADVETIEEMGEAPREGEAALETKSELEEAPGGGAEESKEEAPEEDDEEEDKQLITMDANLKHLITVVCRINNAQNAYKAVIKEEILDVGDLLGFSTIQSNNIMAV